MPPSTRILYLEDDPSVIEAIEHMLTTHLANIQLTAVDSRRAFLAQLQEQEFQLVLIDYFVPGYEGVAALRDSKRIAAQTPVIVISGQLDEGSIIDTLKLGATDYVLKQNMRRFLPAVERALKEQRLQKSLKDTQSRLIAVEDTLHDIAENIPGCIYQYVRQDNGKQSLRYISKGFYQLVEIEESPDLPPDVQQIFTFVHPDDHDLFLHSIEESAKTLQPWRHEFRILSAKKRIRWIRGNSIPHLQLDNTIVWNGVLLDITSEKQVEIARQNDQRELERKYQQTSSQYSRSEATLRATFEAMLDAVIVINDQGIIESANNSSTEIFGYGIDEMVGNNIAMLMPTPFAGEHDQYLQNYKQTGQVKVLGIGREARGQRKNGSIFPMDLAVNKISLQRETKFVGIVRDISKRKAIEQALTESDERLRRSQVYANMGTWDWNIQSGQLFWSERIPALFGHAAGELETSYDNFVLSIHPDDRDAVVNAIHECITNGNEYDIEHRCVWPDGSIHWLLEKGDVTRDEQGEPLHMLGVVQDITKRKEAEEALKQSKQQLGEAQKIARLGNWTLDINTGAVNWSDEIYRIFGYSPGSIQPSTEVFFNHVHPDDIARVKKSEQATSMHGEKQSIDHRIVQANGEIRWVHAEAIAIPGKDGQPVAMKGAIQDVTERKQIERDLLDAKESAEQANRAKSEFLSRMSHELRTPLNAIIGFSQLMEMDCQLSEEHTNQIKDIHQAGNHLLELVNEILDLARIESGRFDLSLERVSVADTLQECVLMLKPTLAYSSVTLHMPGSDVQQISVQADRIRFKQVMLNLLSNAIKYNRKQGSISVEVMQLDSTVRLSISDTGIGIPHHKMDGLFVAFNRMGAENSEIQGTGIGLVITKSLLEAMGGSIDVRSEEGKGSTFSIELPTAP